MELLSDGLLIAAAATAALYCWVLSRRLSDLKDMDKGLGGAIASLSDRVEKTRTSLADTRETTTAIARDLAELTHRAELAAKRLEGLLETQKAADEAAPLRSVSNEVEAATEDPAADAPATEEQILATLKRLAAGTGAR